MHSTVNPERNVSIRNTANGGFLVETYERNQPDYPYASNNTYSFTSLTDALAFATEVFNKPVTAPVAPSAPTVNAPVSTPSVLTAPSAPVVEAPVAPVEEDAV